MGLATLYNVPSDVNEMNMFSFNNMAEHTKIALTLFSKYNFSMPSFVLDPLPVFDPGNWLQQHQTLHNIMSSVLGVNSNDLTTVDLKNKNQLSEWIWLHAQEHFQAADILGLT